MLLTGFSRERRERDVSPVWYNICQRQDHIRLSRLCEGRGVRHEPAYQISVISGVVGPHLDAAMGALMYLSSILSVLKKKKKSNTVRNK